MYYFDFTLDYQIYNAGLVLGTNNWNSFTHRFIIYKLFQFLISIPEYLKPISAQHKVVQQYIVYRLHYYTIITVQLVVQSCYIYRTEQQCSRAHSFQFVLCFVFCVCMFPLDWPAGSHSPISAGRVQCNDQDHSTLLDNLSLQIR